MGRRSGRLDRLATVGLNRLANGLRQSSGALSRQEVGFDLVQRVRRAGHATMEVVLSDGFARFDHRKL